MYCTGEISKENTKGFVVEILVLAILTGITILMFLWFGWVYLFLSVSFIGGWILRGLWNENDGEK